MPRIHQLRFQCPEIIYLAVAHDLNGAVLVGHRLTPSGAEVDYREAPLPQSRMLIDVFANGGGASMGEGVAQCNHSIPVDASPCEINYSADSTHDLVSSTTIGGSDFIADNSSVKMSVLLGDGSGGEFGLDDLAPEDCALSPSFAVPEEIYDMFDNDLNISKI